jgi:fructokinase
MYLICGEALYDIFVDPAASGGGRHVTLSARPGGSPHNVAIGLARLGCPVAFATETANDTLGRLLEQRLATEGVNCQFVRRTAASTPLAMVDIDQAGVPRFVFHGLDRVCYHPELSAVKKLWMSLCGVHVGSIPIVSDQSAAQLEALAADAPEHVLLSLDPNVRLSHQPDANRWQMAVDKFRRYAHLIKVSEGDLVQLYGVGVDLDAVATSWLAHRCSLVVVTRSEKGATLYSRAHGRLIIKPVSVVVADTVGAGDSFQAAMLAWLAERKCETPLKLARLSAAELNSLGSFAARAAAITCRFRGPEFPYRKSLG